LGDISYNEQGNIFTALPQATYNPGVKSTTQYMPVVAEVPVTSHGEVCQSIKSEATLLGSANVTVPEANDGGVPDGKYVAFAIIDPGAAVYGLPASDGTNYPADGVGLQHWGWYNQYLLAYLNGGYIPTAGGVMATQKIYSPSAVSFIDGGVMPAGLGAGFDVLQYAIGQPGYSPVCQVMTYSAPDGGPIPVSAVPQSAQDIDPAFAPVPDDPPYIFCLQLQ
jgi:hypothetical protein